MRASEVKGKRIVKVQQTRFWNKRTARWVVSCDGIELEDGSMLFFNVIELEGDYAVKVNLVTLPAPFKIRRCASCWPRR